MNTVITFVINQKFITHFSYFQEIKNHIDELKAKYGSFEYAEKCTTFDVQNFSQLTRQMLPAFNPEHDAQCNLLEKVAKNGESSDDNSDSDDDDDDIVKESHHVPNPTNQSTPLKRLCDAPADSGPAKTMRHSIEGNANSCTLDEKWYKSKEAEMKEDLCRVLMKFEANNLTSFNKIRTIENEMANLKNENIDLKATVEKLEQEVAAGKIKIEALEGSGKKCTHCNKPLDTPLYCDKKCHDGRLRELLSQQQQTHS